MLKNARTTYRGEIEDGRTAVRKAFAVERADIKVWKEENEDGTEVTMIDVPVSSTSPDRDGDAFSEDGLDHQIQQIQSGTVGMWLDHGLSAETGWHDYRLLDAVGGWKDAELGDDDVLRAKAALRPSSEEARELETMLDEGVAPVSFSVGFIIETENERDDIPGKEFESIDLLEISAVGIPSNPDATVTDSAIAMAKSIASETEYDGETDQLARSLQREFRDLGRDTDNDTQTMASKDNDNEEDEDEEEEEEEEAESESEEEEEEDEEEETESEEGDGKTPSGIEMDEFRSAMRSEFLSVVTESEEFRSEMASIVTDALSETDGVELSFEEESASRLSAELESRLFDSEEGADPRTPSGTITTFDNGENEDGDGKSKANNDGETTGDGRSLKRPRPNYGN